MATDWGMAAGGAQDALQALIEQRILQERMALAQRQQQAEEAHRAALLAEQQAGRGDEMTRHRDTFSQRVKEHEDAAPGRAADVDYKRSATDRNVYETGRARQLDPQTDAAMDELAQNPTTAGLVRFKRAGVPITPTDPNDVTGSVEHERNLARIKASGDQNVRSAAAGRSARTVTIKTIDENGTPVTRVVPIDEAVGQEFEATPTAEMRNRGGAGRRAEKVVDRLEALSKRINVNKGLMATATGAAKRAAAKVNYENDVAEYTRYLAGNAPLIARAFGHTGVLTELDVQSVIKAAPSPEDNDELASRLIAGMRQTMAEMATTDKQKDGGVQPPGNGKQITLANLRAKAKTLNMTEEAARADAEARGYTIIP